MKVDTSALGGFSPVSTTRIFWKSRKRSGNVYFVFISFSFSMLCFYGKHEVWKRIWKLMLYMNIFFSFFFFPHDFDKIPFKRIYACLINKFIDLHCFEKCSYRLRETLFSFDLQPWYLGNQLTYCLSIIIMSWLLCWYVN